MTDNLTKDQRRKNMQHIRSQNSKPEKVVRTFLHKHGLRFRLHRKDLPGKPDIVLPKYNAVIFINGCFWHQHPRCKRATIPKSNRDYWIPKLEKNKKRDKKNKKLLKDLGWKIIIIWECQLKTNQQKKTLNKIRTRLVEK